MTEPENQAEALDETQLLLALDIFEIETKINRVSLKAGLAKAICAYIGALASLPEAPAVPVGNRHLQLARLIVQGRSFNRPSDAPGERLVGFRVPKEVAGLSDALFAMDAVRSALQSSPPVKADETECPICDRHVTNEPATGWLAACGRRLSRLDECGEEPRCTRDEFGETVFPPVKAAAVDGAVAYRWRIKGAETWVYDPTPDWIAAQRMRDDIDIEPLYTRPAVADAGVREALREAFEAMRYQPGDHPVVPVKIAAFMKEVERILSLAAKRGQANG